MVDYDTIDETIAQLFPYDGPHSRESVLAAASAVAQLTRYLANATQASKPLEWAQTVYGLIGSLNDSVHGMVQVNDQLAGRIAHLALSGAIYDDRGASVDPGVTAEAVRAGLRNGGTGLREAVEHFATAHNHASHLGNR